MQEQWQCVVLTRRWKKNDRGDLQRLPPLFIILAGGDNHRYLQKKKHNKQSILFFFSPFQICSRVCFSALVCCSFLFRWPIWRLLRELQWWLTTVVLEGCGEGVLSRLRRRHYCWEEEMKERSGLLPFSQVREKKICENRGSSTEDGWFGWSVWRKNREIGASLLAWTWR